MADLQTPSSRETAGRPFLTVKLLVAFLDWTISKKLQVLGGKLGNQRFMDFCSESMKPKQIGLNSECDFFREAISTAIGRFGQQDNPPMVDGVWHF